MIKLFFILYILTGTVAVAAPVDEAYQDIYGNVVARIQKKFYWGNKRGTQLFLLKTNFVAGAGGIQTVEFAAPDQSNPTRLAHLTIVNGRLRVNCAQSSLCFRPMDEQELTDLDKSIANKELYLTGLPSGVRQVVHVFRIVEPDRGSSRATSRFIYIEAPKFMSGKDVDQYEAMIGEPQKLTVPMRAWAEYPEGLSGPKIIRFENRAYLRIGESPRYWQSETEPNPVPLIKQLPTVGLLKELGIDEDRFRIPRLRTPCDLFLEREELN